MGLGLGLGLGFGLGLGLGLGLGYRRVVEEPPRESDASRGCLDLALERAC